MIICYEGTPGSGKSYDAVRKIADNLKLGRTIYTNIDGLNDVKCREYLKIYTNLDDYEIETRLIYLDNDKMKRFWCPDILKDEVQKSDYYKLIFERNKDSLDFKFSEFFKIKDGSLIVIDEVHKLFNCRDWSTQVNREFSDWASTHRHNGYDVLLLTQNIGKIDSAVRGLVEWTYRYKKIGFFGSLVKNSYICHVFQEDGSGKPVTRIIRKYVTAIFNCYKSYVSKDMKELGIQPKTNILKHPIFFVIPVVLAFFIYFFFKSSFAKGQIFPTSIKSVAPKVDLSKKVDLPKDVFDFTKSKSVSVPHNPNSLSHPLPLLSNNVPQDTPIIVRKYKITGIINIANDMYKSYVFYDEQTFQDGKLVLVSSLKSKAFDFDLICRCFSINRFKGGEVIDALPPLPSF